VGSRLRTRQRGIALVVLLALVGFIMMGVLLTIAHSSAIETQRQRQTAQALARAKEALVAYAVAVKSDSLATRPGDLPCPDLDDDGHAELTCSATSKRLGRLPWKTLGLSDLRDADGERLWYALSTNFDRSTVNQCTTPGGAKCLNSETPGTITVRDASGAIVHDGTTPANNPAVVPSGAIAVVLAPGAVITRLGGASAQDRSCSGDADVAGCESSGICSSTATARCSPVNYLDIADSTVLPALAAPEDNKDFADATNDNGFIAGPLHNPAGDIVVNDTLIVVRYSDLMPKLEQRVAREALACLRNYARDNAEHYPWAASVSDNYALSLADTSGTYFGRLAQTLNASKTNGFSDHWPQYCPIGMQVNEYKWWANWVNLVFYGIAPGYAPDASLPGCGACLTVNPPSASASRRVVVLVAGRPITGQIRGVGSSTLAYLEDANRDGYLTMLFKQAAATAAFNDTVVYQ
jgi:type II secretory pathway pseudopilin PulG